MPVNGWQGFCNAQNKAFDEGFSKHFALPFAIQLMTWQNEIYCRELFCFFSFFLLKADNSSENQRRYGFMSDTLKASIFLFL